MNITFKDNVRATGNGYLYTWDSEELRVIDAIIAIQKQDYTKLQSIANDLRELQELKNANR